MSQRIALVTGASSGIGRATAELLARNGYYVFAAARRVHRLEQIRSDHIEPIQLDVTNEEVVGKAVRILIKKKV
jgi:NADP-dependent 3-hydroxy acid dehydrogenase YdfG